MRQQKKARLTASSTASRACRCCACASAAAASAAVMGCCADALLAAKPLPPPASIRNAEKAACAAGTRPRSEAAPDQAGLQLCTLYCAVSTLYCRCHRAGNHHRYMMSSPQSIPGTASATEEAGSVHLLVSKCNLRCFGLAIANPTEHNCQYTTKPSAPPDKFICTGRCGNIPLSPVTIPCETTAPHPGEEHGQR